MANIKTQNFEDKTVISVSGRIDSTNAPDFEKDLSEVSINGKLILDLDELEYISSAGLRVILHLRKEHVDLELINASSEVYEILEMTGFSEMMKVVKAYRRVSVDGCEIIGQGANGAVYRLDNDTVVKVYLNADSLADIEHERSVARKALVYGIPTAISYDVVRVGDHYASMFELLNAKSFSKLLIADPANVDKYAKMYIDMLKLIHSTVVEEGDLPDQKEVTLSWCEMAKPVLTDEQYQKICRLVNDIPHDNHMIHGDYHTKNLMLQNDEVILIDMDTLAVGHPVLEFASMYNAYVGFSYFNHANLKEFLGFDYEVGQEFWKKSLMYYYDSTDEEYLKKKENQAKVVGLLRILRRCIRRCDPEETINAYKEIFVEALNSVDSLID